MNQTSTFNLFANPFLAWSDLVLISTQMMVTSAQVIDHRTSRMMLAGVPLMMSLATSVTPRQSAARQTNLVRAGLANAAEANSRIAASIPRIAHKGLRPLHSKATANRKPPAKHAANGH